MLLSAEGQTVRNAVAAARRAASLPPRTTREVLRSGGEDGLYRVLLEGDHVVEVTVRPGAMASAYIVERDDDGDQD